VSTAPSRNGKHRSKPERLGDLDAARAVVAVARTREAPDKATFDRLRAEWCEAALLAEDRGDAGLVEWLQNERVRLARTPERFEALAQAIAAAQAEAVGDVEDPVDRPITATELLFGVASDPWYWERWVGRGNITGLGAFEGTGKTRLLLDLSRRAYLAEPAPDGQPLGFTPGARSLWVCSDGHHEELAREAARMGIGDGVLFNGSREQPYGFTDLDEPETFARLERNIDLARPELVIIDTLTNATSRNLGDQSDVKLLMTPLKDLAIRYRVALVLSMHLNRGGDILGRRLRGWCRTILKLDCPDEDQPGRLRLEVFKSYAKRPEPIGVTLGDDGNDYTPEAPGRKKGGRPAGAITEARRAILDALRRQNDQPGSALANMVEAREIASKRTGWNAIDALVAEGLVTLDGSHPKIAHLNSADGAGADDAAA
jgi:hypothetical protein